MQFGIALLLLFTIIFGIFEFAKCARVLLTTMDQGRSHANSFSPFLHRLQDKGNHTVGLEFTIYHEEMDFGIKEERFINMSEFRNPFVSDGFNDMAFKAQPNFLHFALINVFASLSCKTVLENRKTRFLEIANEDWDIFLSDSLFSTCGYAMAEIQNKPHIMMHSTDVEMSAGSFKGFGRNYGILPPNNMLFSMSELSIEKFLDRVYTATDYIGQMFAVVVVGGIAQKWALQSVIGFPYFSFYNFNRLSSFTFTDMPDTLFPPASRTNDFFSFGAYCKNASLEQLPEDFRSFVEDEKSKGTILISFGTFIDWRFAPKDKLEIFINVVNKLTDYRIIWSMKGDRPDKLGKHVKTSGWVPQNQILHHNKTVLFLSHGGLKSVKEAICSATPTIFMPMFGEQMRNAWLAKEKGFAEVLNKLELSENILEEVIHQMVTEPKYKKNAEKFLKFYMDQPIPTLDEAAWKFDRIMKYGGKMPKMFYPRAIELTFLNYSNLDIIFIAPLLMVYMLVE